MRTGEGGGVGDGDDFDTLLVFGDPLGYPLDVPFDDLLDDTLTKRTAITYPNARTQNTNR